MPELPTSLREQLRALLPDEGYKITPDEVMASIEHSRVEGSRTTDPTPVTARRRVTGLAPALAWMLGILVLAAMGVGIFVGVNGTSAGKPASVGAIGELSDRLVLDSTQVVAGQMVSGSVVIDNPGKTFAVRVACMPVQVLLNRGTFHQPPLDIAKLCRDYLSIRHGTTRLTVTVSTTVDGCIQSGPSQPLIPMCLADGDIPPLPLGTYMAKVAWGEPMPLPEPKGVALTLVAKAHTSATTSTTTPSITTSTTSPTSALPGAPPCDTGPTTGPAIKPSEIFFGCATSADYLGPITWSKWTSTSASGTATHNVDSCQPNCAAGTYTRFPVAVQLSNPGYLGGIFVFQTITTTPTSSAGKPESSTAAHLYGSWGWPSS